MTETCAACGYADHPNTMCQTFVSRPLTPADVQVGDWVRTIAPNGYRAFYEVTTVETDTVNGYVRRSWITEVRRG